MIIQLKKYIFIFILLFSATHILAQKQGKELIDSLKIRLIQSKEDTSKVRLLGKLSFQYFRFDTDSGIYYADQGIILAEKLQWELGLAFCYNYKGINFGVKGNYPNALVFFHKAFEKYSLLDDKIGIAYSSNNLGNLYRFQKDFKKAIDYFTKAANINLELHNELNLSKNYNNMGLCYSSLSDFAKSDEYYYKAMSIVEKNNNKEIAAQILINLAENRMNLKNYCQAVELSIKAIKISDEMQITYDQAVYNRYVGEVYYRIACDTTSDIKKCDYYTNNNKKNLEISKQYLIHSIKLQDKINDLSLLSESSLILSQVYEKLGDAKNALHYYKQYNSSKDSIFSNDNSLKIANIEKKQELELRDKQIKIQTLEIEKKNAQIKLQIFLFLLIIIMISIFLYFYIKNRKNEKKFLIEQERKKNEKALRESEEKYRNIFENAQEGIFQTTISGAYIAANPALANMYGFDSPQELIKCRTNISTEAYSNHQERNFFLQLMNNQGYVKGYEYEVIRKDGQKIWFYEDAQAIKDENGNILYFEGFVVDITPRKQAELLLKQKNDQIEAQNKEYKLLNEELIKAKNKAEENDKLKTSFLQNMSHEVRTPLNAIVGFSQLMTDKNQSPDKINSFSQIILTSSYKLLDIIADVIEISQIHANQVKVKLQNFDFIAFLIELVNSFQEKAKEKNLQLLLSMNIQENEYFILSDSEKLKKIFNHLIDNAIKFTIKGSVKIECQNISNSIQISFSDTGIGISEHMQKNIFEPFRQVESGVIRDFGGNGLGLTISKAYVEMLNGSIVLQSTLNIGSTFTITIPAEKIIIHNEPEKINGHPLSLKTVLIAEDEYTNYLYLKELLDEMNLKLLYVSNGQDALDMCKTNSNIDLIFMDIKMPIMDGYTAAKLIKAFRPNLPIVAQTAYALENEKQQFSNIFDDYLEKPILQQKLIQIITKYNHEGA